MFGRQVAAAFRLPLPTRLTPTVQFQWQGRSLFTTSRQLYATPGRPRTAVGEPTRTVKRSAKKTATKSPAEKPASGAVKTVKKKQTKAASKAKPKSQKKAAPKKPAKNVPKQLTEKQLAAKQARTDKAKKAALKALILDPPKIAKSSAWVQFLQEKAGAELKGTAGGDDLRSRLAQVTRSTAAEWKNVTPAEREHYNHLSHTQREKQTAEYKRWVESHTPAEIRAANTARRSLNRINSHELTPKQRKRPQLPMIMDERHVKQPLSAYLLFNLERQLSGDFKAIIAVERQKLIAQEWKTLSQGEKKKFDDLHHAEQERYRTEYQATLGHAPPSPRPAAAAAAA